MAVHRKRFRVEDIAGGEMPILDVTEEAIPMHSEIMAELRAIRAQMAKGVVAAVATATVAATPPSTRPRPRPRTPQADRLTHA